MFVGVVLTITIILTNTIVTSTIVIANVTIPIIVAIAWKPTRVTLARVVAAIEACGDNEHRFGCEHCVGVYMRCGTPTIYLYIYVCSWAKETCGAVP